MAITYPRPWPGLIAQAEFKVDDGILLDPLQGGRVIAVAGAAEPRWVARFQTGKLYGARLNDYEAFIRSLKSGAGTFYAEHPDRPYPFAYRTGFAGLNKAGGGAFTGPATSWATDTNRTALSCTNLPAGFVVSAMDMVELNWSSGTKKFLSSFLEGGVANGSGALASLSIWPRIPSWVPGDAVLTFARPSCIMRMKPGSDSMPLNKGNTVFSFEAIQALVP